MSYCLNSECQKPQNSEGDKFCQSCGMGLLLGDRYRALKPISRGNRKTYLAVDEYKPSKPRCALKQFFPQVQGTNTVSSSAVLFEREAARLDELGLHPQIPELLAYFTQDNRQYLVQEFIDGQNLARELAEEGAFSETQIRQLLNDLLPVLQFIHNGGVIHRDIKPENIIRRSSDSQLVLVDFGAAIFAPATAIQKTGTAQGSAEYVAPEQAKGLAVFASDIYSLGVVCIHLLTEIPPFDLFDASEDRWVWQDYLSGSRGNELSQIIDKMLERSTKHRYRSATEVLADLNRLQNQAAPPVTHQYKQQKVDVRSTSTLAADITLNSDRVETISPVPLSVSFATERFLLGGFAIMTLLSGSLSPNISVLTLGSLISLILIIFSYRFQSFPEVAKKYALITKIRNQKKEIVKIEKSIKNLKYKKDKLTKSDKNIVKGQLQCKDKEKNEINEVEDLLKSAIAEIESQQSALNSAETKEIVQETHKSNSQFIADRLAEYIINSANIAGIGPEITRRLQEGSVKTAADIEYDRVINIHGVGESRASNLISWRKQVESEIINNLPNDWETTIREKYKERHQLLEIRLTAAEQAAREKKDAIRRNYQQQQDQLAKRLKSVREKIEAAGRKLEEKINKESQNLHESCRTLAELEQTLEGYDRVNFAAYMKRILFFS